MARKQDPEAFFRDLLALLLEGSIEDKEGLHRAKVRLAREHGLARVPADAEVLGAVPPGHRDRLLPLLRTKAVREVSGVVTVAAMTSPERCPHGRCLYCPGGVENLSPQSYTGREPAALRGAHHGYDAFMEVRGRLDQLGICGHPVDKVDLIVMGGTFLARPFEYQLDFVTGCYDALNAMSPPPGPEAGDGGAAGRPAGRQVPASTTSSDIPPDRPVHPRSLEERFARLTEAVDRNESAPARCTGLTVETRPDWCFEDHVDRMLLFGTTRVEIGVQSLSDSALERMKRGHGTAETMRATRLARDAGLKVGYHVMPGFPFVGREEEASHYRRLFEDPLFRPDLLKIYPTLVLPGTGLWDLWKRGEYEPLSTEEAVEFLSEAKARLPPWVRVQRIQRDIPVQLIAEGVKKSNLRELIKRRMAQKGTRCGCIRCREVGHLRVRVRDGTALKLGRMDYEASGGTEAFLSLDTPEGALAGYLRLRRPSQEAHRAELRESRSAVVRELRVLGEMVPLEGSPGERWQHRGLGLRLLKEAEGISREWGMERLLVNSGAGARGYYGKLGYIRIGPYMGRAI